MRLGARSVRKNEKPSAVRSGIENRIESLPGSASNVTDRTVDESGCGSPMRERPAKAAETMEPSASWALRPERAHSYARRHAGQDAQKPC